MASISLNHIKKVYPGDIEVISDLNLQIKDKEFVVPAAANLPHCA